MANTYDVGDLPRVSAVFTTPAGVDTDPTVVKFVYQAPGGTAVTLTYGTDAALVRDSAGHYHVDVSLTVAGTWSYRWYSTGTGQASEPGWLIANANQV